MSIKLLALSKHALQTTTMTTTTISNPSHWHSFQLSIKGHSNWQFYCILPGRTRHTHTHKLFIESAHFFSSPLCIYLLHSNDDNDVSHFSFGRDCVRFFKALNPFAAFKSKFHIQSMPSSCRTCFSLNFQIDTQLN